MTTLRPGLGAHGGRRRALALGLALIGALAATPGLALVPAVAPLGGSLGAPPGAGAATRCPAHETTPAPSRIEQQ
jgi:hypothetical protein